MSLISSSSSSFFLFCFVCLSLFAFITDQKSQFRMVSLKTLMWGSDKMHESKRRPINDHESLTYESLSASV